MQTCVFINAEGEEIHCNEERADGLTCLNDKEVAYLEKKLNRCNNRNR